MNGLFNYSIASDELSNCIEFLLIGESLFKIPMGIFEVVYDLLHLHGYC
jgi:hypothetical protein